MAAIPILLVLIPALPLAATLVTASLGKRVLREQSHAPVVAAVPLAVLASLTLLALVRSEAVQAASRGNRLGYERIVPLWTWASAPSAVVGVPALAGNGTGNAKEQPPKGGTPTAASVEVPAGGASLSQRGACQPDRPVSASTSS